ncbi:MAG: hypothetical protein K2N78_03465 [Oscillospiraceae bacterium]|nr:hypothetical protein [Oscillospiraceae bacterium]
MKKWILAAALAVCLLLCGCAALLERSYSLMEPYADRYWDSSAEDTLKIDNYQDLVNSLVMLIEQRAEEAVIRCYDEVSAYQQVMKARNEVRRDTVTGSYLLKSIQFTFEEGANYSTASFTMAYREDTEDLDGVMTLSDSQSLVDLLRLAIREEHEKIIAQFIYDTPRAAVNAAVESYWQELCQDEMEDEMEGDTEPAMAESGDELLPEGGEEGESAPGEPESEPEEPPEDAPAPEDGEPVGDAEPVSSTPEDVVEPEPIMYPPCPWEVRFYPNQEMVELVEIWLRQP